MTQAVTATRMAQTAARTAKETKKGDSETVDTNAAASRSAACTCSQSYVSKYVLKQKNNE